MSNPFYLISIVLSALLTFFTAVVLLELGLKLFRVQNKRIQASLRMLPFASFLLEFSFHSFGKYNLLNPLSCSSCIQKLILSTFFPDLHTYLSVNRIPLVEYLAIDHHLGIFSAFSIGWILITLFIPLWWGFRVILAKRRLKAILESGKSCERSIRNKQLLQALQFARARVIVSSEVTVPLATYKGVIAIPKRLIDQLNQQEFESIIAHELEHIKQSDPIQRLAIDAFSALFWWVPTKWYKKRIENNQEMACDQAITKYSLDSAEFASALMKVDRSSCMNGQVLLCSLSGKKSGTFARLQVVLGVEAPPKETFVAAGLIVLIEAAVLAMCMIFL